MTAVVHAGEPNLRFGPERRMLSLQDDRKSDAGGGLENPQMIPV